MSFDPDLAGHLISADVPEILDVFGPTIEILTVTTDDPTAPALLRGTLPAGAVVPLHAHSEPETFYVLSGTAEVLVVAGTEVRWVPVAAGQVFHIPPGARHALRNTTTDPTSQLVISTPAMARFFEITGRPVDAVDAPRQPPTPADLSRMLTEAATRGYWNASPEENAAVGITLPPPPHPGTSPEES